MGCIQATEVIKNILGQGEVLSGRLLVYDALKMSFREVELVRQPFIPEVSELIDYQGFCGGARSAMSTAAEKIIPPYQDISVEEAVARFRGGWSPFVLDVRLPQEAEIVALPFSDKLCPHRQVASIASDLPRDRDVLVHCKAGSRSATACNTLIQAGISPEKLFNMKGGILAWARQVDPSMPTY